MNSGFFWLFQKEIKKKTVFRENTQLLHKTKEKNSNI